MPSQASTHTCPFASQNAVQVAVDSSAQGVHVGLQSPGQSPSMFSAQVQFASPQLETSVPSSQRVPSLAQYPSGTHSSALSQQGGPQGTGQLLVPVVVSEPVSVSVSEPVPVPESVSESVSASVGSSRSTWPQAHGSRRETSAARICGRAYHEVVSDLPVLRFGTPRKLPKASSLPGRVAVLDVAFAADQVGSPFEKVTGTFLRDLGDRLAVWVDHHDHERQRDFASDPRFVLATKAQHGACPEMVTPELVLRIGKVDTILCHTDFDGICAAAKWVLGGIEPYTGADDDARAIDTRMGFPSPEGVRLDRALRGRPRDDALKQTIFRYLAGRATDPALRAQIKLAAAEAEALEEGAKWLAEKYALHGRIALVDVGADAPPFDKTTLLLLGQQKATIAVVRHKGSLAIAAAFDSGVDLLKILGIDGGMPTRISISEKRLDEVLEKLR